MSAAPRKRALTRGATSRDVEEYFAPQRARSADLPPPDPLLRNLALGVVEVLAGVREADQLARWLGEDAFRALVTRANLSARARSARGIPAVRPTHRIGSVRHSSPADGVVEAVVIVSGPARTRALALRLEGWDNRWRATSLSLL